MKNMVRRSLALVMALLLALGAMGAMAAAKTVVINEKNFPDAVFRKYVGSEEIDKNTDGVLSADEIGSVTYIGIGDMGISKLNGIEYFTSLTELDCSFNKIKKLDLSKNKKLVSLDCHGNKMTGLTLPASNMTYLDCSMNKLSKLDLNGNAKLKKMATKQLSWANKECAFYGKNDLVTDIKTKLTWGKTVLRKYGKPKSVSFTKSKTTVEPGCEAYQLPNVIYGNMNPATAIYPITYKSNKPKVFKLLYDEMFCAGKAGKATLTVTSGGKKGKLAITVK